MSEDQMTVMKEQGLIYDAESGSFFHVYYDRGKLKIDKEPCQHRHFGEMIVLVE